MLALGELAVTKLEKVEFGHLVLCTADDNHWELGLKVEAPGANREGEEWQHGLLHLGRDRVDRQGKTPWAFPESGHIQSVDLGIPQFVWRNPTELHRLPVSGFTPGLIYIRRGDPALAAFYGNALNAAWWSVRTGRYLPQPGAASFCVSRWAVGVKNINGRFQPLLRYPEDYQAQTPASS